MLFAAVLYLEDVDEYLYTSEDCLFLHQEILFHECVLSSAIPEVESEGSHELEFVFLAFDGVADLLGVFGREVGEDD